MCDFDGYSSPLISDIEISQNSIKTEIDKNIKQENFECFESSVSKKCSNSIFISQQRSRPIKKEPVEELCTIDDSISSPLISDIEVSKNSIKSEIDPDVKEEKFEL